MLPDNINYSKYLTISQISCRPSGKLPDEMQGVIDMEKPQSFFDQFLRPWEWVALRLRDKLIEWKKTSDSSIVSYDYFLSLIPQINEKGSLNKDQVKVCQSALFEIFCNYAYIDNKQINLLKVIHIEIIYCLRKLGLKEIPKKKKIRDFKIVKNPTSNNKINVLCFSQEEENKKLKLIENFQENLNENFFKLSLILTADKMDQKEIELIRNNFQELYKIISTLDFSNDETSSIQKYLSILITACSAPAVLLPHLIMTLVPFDDENINVVKQLEFTKRTVNSFAWQNLANEKICDTYYSSFRKIPLLANQFQAAKQAYSTITNKTSYLFNQIIEEIQSQFKIPQELRRQEKSIQNLTNQENHLQYFWGNLKNEINQLNSCLATTYRKQVAHVKRIKQNKVVLPCIENDLDLKFVNKSSLPLFDCANKMILATKKTWVRYLERISESLQDFDKTLPSDWVFSSFGLFSRLDLLKLQFLNILDTFYLLDKPIYEEIRTIFSSLNTISFELRMFYQKNYTKSNLENTNLDLLNRPIDSDLLQRVKTTTLFTQKFYLNLPDCLSLEHRSLILQLALFFKFLDKILSEPGGAFFICAPIPQYTKNPQPLTHELVRQQANQALSIFEEYISSNKVNFVDLPNFLLTPELEIDKEEIANIITKATELLASNEGEFINDRFSNQEILKHLPKNNLITDENSIEFSQNLTDALNRFRKNYTALIPIEQCEVKELKSKISILLETLRRFQEIYDSYYVSFDRVLQNITNKSERNVMMQTWGGIEEILYRPMEILKSYESIEYAQIPKNQPNRRSTLSFTSEINTNPPSVQSTNSNDWENSIKKLNRIKYFAEEILLATQNDNHLFKNFILQIFFQINAIDELIKKAKVNKDFNRLQAHSLLRHLSSILEQSLKIAAQSQTGGKANEINFTHDLEQLLENVMYTSLSDKHIETIRTFNNFLTIHGRYLIGMHPFNDILEKMEKHSDEGIVELGDYSNQCLEVIDTLFSNMHIPSNSNIRQSRLINDHISSLLNGIENEKLLSPNNLKSLNDKNKLLVSVCDLKNAIQESMHMQEIPPVSISEPYDQILKRKQQVRFNLQSLKAVCEALEDLIKDENAASWCSSYASAMLLKCAVLIEKSAQSFLAVLPIKASDNENEHVIFSLTEKNVPVRFCHTFSEWFKIMAIVFANNEMANEELQINRIREQTSWLQPVVQQLYRYPYDTSECEAGKILLHFDALSQLRSALHQDKVVNGNRKALAKMLNVSPDVNLKTILDNSIRSLIEKDLFQAANIAVNEAKNLLVMWKNQYSEVG